MIEHKYKALFEKVILIGIITHNQDYNKTQEYLDELELLAVTAKAKVFERFTQKLVNVHKKTFIGTGKLKEIFNFVKKNNIDTIIFDDELSPVQIKNIEIIFSRKILDRTQLILDIFAQRAHTFYAKKQVELAQYQYLLPRLQHMWTHLERQKGGIGLRGPGETEIETDRRSVRDRIFLLRKQIKVIDKQMTIQRNNRKKFVRVALIGYTNVGKSTLMNSLSKTSIFVENKLFATLDTTVRKVVIFNIPFLLTDTVGFIRKLPTLLIESFKSTLDEVREADILIHVVDISHNNFENHIKYVKDILLEIKVSQKPTITIFNKIDIVEYSYFKSLEKLLVENFIYSKLIVFVSAKKKIGFLKFKHMLYNEVKKLHIKRYPYNNFLYPRLDDSNAL